MKTLLLFPVSLDEYIDLPYGLGVLAAHLRKENCECEIRDLNAEIKQSRHGPRFLRDMKVFIDSQERAKRYIGLSDVRTQRFGRTLIERINPYNYDMIGISIMTPSQFMLALLIAQTIKQEYQVPVVLGGTFVSGFAEVFFKQYEFLDFAVVGDGEIPLRQLLKVLQQKSLLQSVDNLYYRQNGSSCFTGRKSFDYNQQLRPDYAGLDFRRYGRRILPKERSFVLPYMASHGCNHHCVFCVNKHVDSTWRPRNTAAVIEDLKYFKKHYFSKDRKNFVIFEDSTFNMSYENAHALCDALIEQKLAIQWVARVTASNMDEALIHKMKKAGCHTLRWGIESGSHSVLRRMKKTHHLKKSAQLLKIAHSIGIENNIYVIYNFPYEKPEDLKKTRSFLSENKNNIDLVMFYPLIVIYGSPLYREHKQEGIRLVPKKNTFFCFSYAYEEVKPFPEEQILAKRKIVKEMVNFYFKLFNSR